jgi:hypothetical protein
LTLVLRLNQETVHDFILLFMPPCCPHLTQLATGSLEQSLLVFSTPGGLTGNDRDKTKLKQRAQTTKPKLEQPLRAPPAHMQAPPEPMHANHLKIGQLQQLQLTPVRPITSTG